MRRAKERADTTAVNWKEGQNSGRLSRRSRRQGGRTGWKGEKIQRVKTGAPGTAIALEPVLFEILGSKK